jgi:predicted ATPase
MTDEPRPSPLRIALCGAQGTGKSTLFRGLKARMTGLEFIPEQATEIILEWDQIPQRMSAARKEEFQAEILRRTLALEAAHPAFLSDRCVVDNLAYALGLPCFKRLSERVACHMAARPYTHVFFVRKAFPLVGDGVRSEDVGYQEEIERRIEALLRQFGVPYLPVASADRQGRVDEVLAAIGSPQNRGPT